MKDIIFKIEVLHEENPQYLKLGCLYDNRFRENGCSNCIESKNICREMLKAFKFPPYENER